MRALVLLALPLGAAFVPLGDPEEQPPAAPDFDAVVRPLLSNRCFKCHGPDGNARQAGLRLDQREHALAALANGVVPIVPGDADASELVRRITDADDGLRMPPASEGERLDEDEIALLVEWIEAGAPWSEHWSFVPPAQPPIPEVDDLIWARDPLDLYVQEQLDARGLAPSPEADRTTWLRRVSLDLTGVPPTPEEVDAFLADTAGGAYERQVERLFASGRYGERMALRWLDAARYADTHGYHYDNEREMWPWRDWVVDAFERNLPFDRFTIEQLAGDLLPNATADQRIASGFHRNHMINWEGGIIAEEFLAEYVVDRVSTTATVWMGLTIGCARCHDHKFDPIAQREFYELYDFFHQVPEQGIAGRFGNADPVLRVPDEASDARLAELDARIAELAGRVDGPLPETDAAQLVWETEARDSLVGGWAVLAPFSWSTIGGAVLEPQGDGSLFATGPHAMHEVYDVTSFTTATGLGALRVEAMADERLPNGGPGRASHSNIVLSEVELEVAPIGDPAAVERVPLVAVHAGFAQTNFQARKTIDGDEATGWALQGGGYGEDRSLILVAERPFGFEGGTAVRVRLRHESGYAQHAIGRFRVSVTNDAELLADAQPSALAPWEHTGPYPVGDQSASLQLELPPTTDPDSVEWTPRPDWTDGAVRTLPGERVANYLRRTVTAPEARTLRVSLGSDDALRLWVNGELAFETLAPRGAAAEQDFADLALRAGENELVLQVIDFGGAHAYWFDVVADHSFAAPVDLLGILAREADVRSEPERAQVRRHYRRRHSEAWAALDAELTTARSERTTVESMVPTTMVMGRIDMPRETRMLARGRYDSPGDVVTADVPDVLPPLDEGGTRDRLALARWLVEPGHPLTARVAVNRFWELLFGRGIVTTSDDFGLQGARPTHPQLLDLLAVDFVESGWDVQALLTRIVLSSTYRQSSRTTPEGLAADPDNVWLSRSPRFRLEAELIRDQALFAAGLLSDVRGGPPVKPYQPPGLWAEVGSETETSFTANRYVESEGEDLWRRTLYTFWKRTLPPPSLRTFDAPTREFCLVRRERTNTPLQALVVLNDPTYVEAARVLATRAIHESADDAAAIERAFRLVLSRVPSEAERATLTALFEDEQALFAAAPDDATALLGVGRAPLADDIAPERLAALLLVAATILNTDEALTRN